MTRRETLLALGLTFAVGCAAAPLVNRALVRPAQAAPEGVRKWDQYCSILKFESAEELSRLDEDARNRGMEGFELAGSPSLIGSRAVSCYKRPRP